jgi:hypothetical protein
LQEIENAKKAALEKPGVDKKKIDQEVKKSIYIPNAKEYVFDLNVINRNSKGEIIEKQPKT